MKPRSCLAAFVAALVVFVWQSVSHMFIPWFHKSLNSFADQNATREFLLENAKVNGELTDGMYLLPNVDIFQEDKDKIKSEQEAAQKQMAEGVSVFAAVVTQGRGGFAESLVKQFIINLAGALLVAFMLSKLSHDGMGCRVGVTVFFALFAIVTAVLPNWTWWAYSGTYTGFLIFDHLVGWTMAGFVLGKMMPKNQPEPEAEEPVPTGAEAD